MDEGAREFRALAHPLRVGADRPAGGFGQFDRLERTVGRGDRVSQTLETRVEQRELEAGQEGMDGLALRDQPDPRVHRRSRPGRLALHEHLARPMA